MIKKNCQKMIKCDKHEIIRKHFRGTYVKYFAPIYKVGLFANHIRYIAPLDVNIAE